MLLKILQNDNGAKKWNQESENFIIKKEESERFVDFLIV